MAGYVAAELFLALPRLDGEGKERGSLNKLPVSPASFRDIEENLREGFEVMLWCTSPQRIFVESREESVLLNRS